MTTAGEKHNKSMSLAHCTTMKIKLSVISLFVLFHTIIVGVWECSLRLLMIISFIQKMKNEK